MDMRFIKKGKIRLFFLLNIIILVILLGLTYPLYKFISHITGYEKIVYLSDNEYVKDSTITSNQIVSKKVIDRKMKINFLAEIDDSLNWNFFSLKENSEIKVGENMVVKFEGKNLSNKPITATADFIAFPEKILPYIIKTECFCFTKQTLKPGESKIFAMTFFLDASLDNDKDLDNIDELSFTYKIYEYKG